MGHHNLLKFHHLHLGQLGGLLGKRSTEEEEGEGGGGVPPKGWMGIRVGGEGEEQKRFIVPVEYLNHPLFLGLLKVAEEEYGFKHEGAITIPCHVEDFTRVKGLIDHDHHDHHHHHHHHVHLHLVGCFRA